VRGFLRTRFPRPECDKGTAWSLTAEQVAAVRQTFAGGQARSPSDTQRHLGIGQSEASLSQAGRTTTNGSGKATFRVPSVHNLTSQGWSVPVGADTASKEQGDDLVATRGGETMVVEVKGYPSRGYADPKRAAEVKRTSPTSQAHHWFAQAMLRTTRTMDRRPPVTVGDGIPDRPRFLDLLAQTWSAISLLGIKVFLVHEDGSVSTYAGPKGGGSA